MTIHAPNAEILEAQWVTSSYSGGGNDCIQAAALPRGLHAVRDSKNPAGPALLMERAVWQSFVQGVRSGRFSQ
ncbi:DUF397 domain-containing protein [Actinacidiphila oryziradicis]|jgi:hypothetical protein|uniref:DUF397 domain-containing protein n=1 Tax=Actinacidiphila oryziradicis TaxID=2571141 RepID=A0A4U0SX58_9ACTN|nr:DUF397 domain-containing protein [Actinacidiphila oryziradicis]TKA12687.1 DUF397 domain-containing protein [Actinacidiphila oryziradicis]